MNHRWNNFGRQIKDQICYENNVIVLKPNTSKNLFNIFSKDFAACLVIQSPLFWGWRALFSTSMSLVEKDLFVQKLFSLGWFFEKAAALPLEIFRQTNRSYQYFSKYKLVLNQILRFFYMFVLMKTVQQLAEQLRIGVFQGNQRIWALNERVYIAISTRLSCLLCC